MTKKKMIASNNSKRIHDHEIWYLKNNNDDALIKIAEVQ